MIANSTIQIRTQKKKKNKVEKILKSEGYTFSSVINLFLEDIIQRGKVPFKISYEPNKETAKAIREARSGVGVKKFDNVEDLINDLES